MLAPAALVLVATDSPWSATQWRNGEMARSIGGNRGCWPARIAFTSAWRDTATMTYDQNPFMEMAAQFRVWCLTTHERDRLAAAVAELMQLRAEEEGSAELRKGFHDLGPGLDLELFEFEVHDIARRLGIKAWDNDGLENFLDRVDRRATALRASSRGFRNNGKAIEAAAQQESAGAR